MQNPHSLVNEDEDTNSEEQGSNLKPIETKKESKTIFQTINIPLESNSLFHLSDIRLKIYPSLNNQLIQPIYLPFPNFAKSLIKTSNKSNILNPKAHLKHLLNDFSIKQEDTSIHKELDERIKLLDKQLEQMSPAMSISNPM